MESLLQSINGPQDLKGRTLKELEELAEEIRRVLLAVVSKTGGHLASLGVVELTLALHSVYDSPKDKIIWDVGHQSYVHKLLTGRRERFSSLRCFGGLSGFPKGEESAHDSVETGHSSTSISAALGLALARDLNQDEYNVVAVIGDGALGGGMALEALNHAGAQQINLTVILNDNEMSISRNVGGLSSYLSRVRTDPKYTRVKQDVEYLMRKIPAIGSTMYKTMDRVKSSLKYLLVSGMVFEEFGFTYLGPIDGHSIADVQRILRQAKGRRGPVLIHVITQKGRGYAAKFHGIGPFDLETGAIKGGNGKSYTQVFSEQLCQLAERDPRIVAICAAMPEGTGLDQFAHKYPGRFFDVGIAEQHAVTLAAGMARSGYRPVVAIYSTFLQRAYDQIVHDVCLPRLPVLFAVDRAGLVGADGETHQGILDISMLRHIPNMTVMMPKDFPELKDMLKLGLHLPGPAAIRYPRGGCKPLPVTLSGAPLSLGQGEVLRQGQDVAIIGLGPSIALALQAQTQLYNMGISAAVLNPRFIKPLDEDLIARFAQRCGRLVVVEEHLIQGGLGSAILEVCSKLGLSPHTRLLGIGDGFVPHGNHQQLLKLCGIDVPDIVAAAKDLVAREKAQSGREKKA